MKLPYRGHVTVPADHPSLAGHFPGRPVVPGVVLLDMVARVLRVAVEAEAQISQLRTAKFHLPVLPGDALSIDIDEAVEGRIQFRILRNVELVADGVLCMKIGT